ncbi:ROK family transcriptional regulator [Mesorhizobium sp. 1B3]|uniref:ROK family transcriptional regulator n=1 Tax=Mesorhizobium sp. 1B3 TaxID=3243599 RepID=UPI003D99BE4E
MGIHHGHVLRILRDEGPQSRAELARRSKLSATTLTHVTAHLLKDGSVIELESGGLGSVGRPAQAIRLAPEAYAVAGVHIGASSIQVTVTDLRASTKAATSFDFAVKGGDPTAIVKRISEAVNKLAEEAQIEAERLIGVGISVPGPVDAARRKAIASINIGWRNVPFADLMEQALSKPAIVEHNVSAMALAESRYGIGKDVPALLYVYLRTGLGAGLVVDGMPFRPGGHGAVELGHIQVTQSGAACACGNTGCLETFVRESTLMHASGLTGSAPEHLLAHVEKNPEAWDVVVRHLTSALASAVNLLTPDLIVFGGHLGEAPDSLFDRLRSDLPPRVMPHMRDILNIQRSSLGSQAGAIGGAATALDHFFYSGVLH